MKMFLVLVCVSTKPEVYKVLQVFLVCADVSAAATASTWSLEGLQANEHQINPEPMSVHLQR